MSSIFRALLLIVLLSYSYIINAADLTDPSGRWQTPRSILKIYHSNGELRAIVVKILNDNSPTLPLCKKCPGKFQNKPIIGMTVIWGLKRVNNHDWNGGQAIDPESGQIYNVKLELSNDGKKITFHASKSLFGHTIEWERIK